MRRFRLRRLRRVNCEALMRAAGQNLKRLLKKCGWGRRPYPTEALCGFFLASCASVTRHFWSIGLIPHRLDHITQYSWRNTISSTDEL